MKRVDQIIAYLSGDLSPDEAAELEEILDRDPEWRELFEEVSELYRTMSRELKRMDEKQFRDSLKSAMQNVREKPPEKNRIRKGLTIGLPLAAASAAVIFVILIPPRDPLRVYHAFYRPAGDAMVQSLLEEVRGSASTGMEAFSRGDMETAWKETARRLETEPDDRSTQLIHLLAAMELQEGGDADESPERSVEAVLAIPPDPHTPLGRSLIWYGALSMVRSGRGGEAAGRLEPLIEIPGTYARDAHKLHRLLTK